MSASDGVTARSSGAQLEAVEVPVFFCAGLAGQDLDNGMPPSSFSEMSPVCFLPVFDEIGEVWLTATVVKGGV
jgi:hypothetical protein